MAQLFELTAEKAVLGPRGQLIGDDRALARAGLILFALLTAWKLYVAVITNVLWDEAHFAVSGQYPDLGYPDIPAGYPWLAWLVTAVGGWHVLPLRLVALVIATATPFAVYFMARPVAEKRYALWAAIIALLCPAITCNGPIFYPEGGLQLLLALMAGCLLRAIKGDKMKWWIAAGVFAGLGLLVHFRFAVAGIAVLGFLIISPLGRSLWTRRGLYVTGALAFLGLLPAIIYNAANAWPAIQFHIVNRPKFEFHFNFIASFFLIQVGIANPVFFPAFLLGCKKAVWDDRNRPGALLGYLGVGILAFYCVQALINKRIMPHWSWMAFVPMVAYAPAILIDFVDKAVSPAARRVRQALVGLAPVIAVALGVVATLLMYLNANARDIPFSLRSFNNAKSENWRLILPALDAARARATARFGNAPAIVAKGHESAVQMEFASPAGTRLYTLDDPDDQRTRFLQARDAWGLGRSDMVAALRGQGVVLALNEPEFVYHDAAEVAFYKDICTLFEDIEPSSVTTLPPDRVAVDIYTARVRQTPQASTEPCRLFPSLYLARPTRGGFLKSDRPGQYFGIAADPIGIVKVDILLDGKVVAPAHYGLDPAGFRAPDVLAYDPNYPKVQFDFGFPAGVLTLGEHRLAIRATRTDGTTVDGAERTVYVK